MIVCTGRADHTRVAPEQIATDTWVIHQAQEALGQPLYVYLNSMVIKGAEPVILDTGTIVNRTQWLDDVFGLVDPADVQWVFISHDDIDHTGNLDEVMTVCPNATLVCSWAILERHSNAFNFPLERCRWINDGESFDVGDRELLAVRPPLWDSPTTRGLFDRSTGVYWGVDSFACPMPGAADEHASRSSTRSSGVRAWRCSCTTRSHRGSASSTRRSSPRLQPGAGARHDDDRDRPQPDHHRSGDRPGVRAHPGAAERDATAVPGPGRARSGADGSRRDASALPDPYRSGPNGRKP